MWGIFSFYRSDDFCRCSIIFLLAGCDQTGNYKTRFLCEDQTAFDGGKQLPDSRLPPSLTAMSLLEKIKWAVLHCCSDAQLLCSARCFCHRLTFCALVECFRLQSKWLILKTEAFAKVNVIMWRLQIVNCICSNCAALKYFHLPTADLVTPIPCPKTLMSPCAQFFCDRANPTHVRVTYYARHAFVALKVVNFALNCFSESSVTPQLSESTWFKRSIICHSWEMDRAAAGLSWQSKGWLVIKWQRSK